MRPRPLWIAAALVASLAWGCESPAAFSVPPGPPVAIGVDVSLPVYVAGNWAVSTFTDALRIELAKYRIVVVDPRTRPAAAQFEVDLGQITYRQWQAIEVRSVASGQETVLGRVSLPDLGMSTVEAAAQPVATIMARWVWRVAPPAP